MIAAARQEVYEALVHGSLQREGEITARLAIATRAKFLQAWRGSTCLKMGCGSGYTPRAEGPGRRRMWLPRVWWPQRASGSFQLTRLSIQILTSWLRPDGCCANCIICAAQPRQLGDDSAVDDTLSLVAAGLARRVTARPGSSLWVGFSRSQECLPLTDSQNQPIENQICAHFAHIGHSIVGDKLQLKRDIVGEPLAQASCKRALMLLACCMSVDSKAGITFHGSCIAMHCQPRPVPPLCASFWQWRVGRISRREPAS